MSTEIKLIAVAVLVIALALGGYLGYRAAYDSGLSAGKAEIQTQWDADKSKIQAVADAAIAQATKDKETAIAANEVIQNDYQAKLDAANASAADFSKRLSNALANLAANRSATGKTPSDTSTPTASTQTSADQLRQLAGLTSDLHAECLANAAQLDALIAEIKPQL